MTVRLSRAAREDLAAIHAYFSERDQRDHADHLVRAILVACDSLVRYPLLGKPGELIDTREWLMTRYPYRIVYQIRGESISVARIMDQRQNWPPETTTRPGE